jgi:hypothetical protein
VSSPIDATQPPSPLCDDITAEAERLTAAAREARLPLRLMGGLAVWLVSPSVRRPPFARQYADLDFAAAKSGAKEVKAFFEAQGYVPEKLFNALHGATRLNYGAPDGRWTVDLILDAMAMSHRLDFAGRLAPGSPTLDLADLLLTKLQVWEVNRKDLGDGACLLADHPLAESDGGAVDLRRIRALLGANWGLCHTVERNLRRVGELVAAEPVSGAPFEVAGQVARLLAEIEGAPKSLAWRARARLGERVRWYETPEEVRH